MDPDVLLECVDTDVVVDVSVCDVVGKAEDEEGVGWVPLVVGAVNELDDV